MKTINLTETQLSKLLSIIYQYKFQVFEELYGGSHFQKYQYEINDCDELINVLKEQKQ